jgi:hypothetical protein
LPYLLVQFVEVTIRCLNLNRFKAGTCARHTPADLLSNSVSIPLAGSCAPAANSRIAHRLLGLSQGVLWSARQELPRHGIADAQLL